jgi:hypothetical protein
MTELRLSEQQRIALAHPCLLPEETLHPRFRLITRSGSIILTINSGFE